jgi:hypothetical protein
VRHDRSETQSITHINFNLTHINFNLNTSHFISRTADSSPMQQIEPYLFTGRGTRFHFGPRLFSCGCNAFYREATSTSTESTNDKNVACAAAGSLASVESTS